MQPLGTNPAETSRDLKPTAQDRRRRVRQKVHTPAYVSFNGNSGSSALDLNEILDISEEGMSIQTSAPLEIRQCLGLHLDLSETQDHIPATGEIIWSDSGRAGIHFPQMADESVARLKEWLFLNTIAACENHAAAEVPTTESLTTGSISSEAQSDLPVPPDYTSILTALEAVTREVDAIGPNLDVALQLLAERAQTFTRATGAAIALFQAADMVCVAAAGDAPGLGMRLQAGSGFSGDCVRTGRLSRCDDAESDPRVDRESCRQLGIRSMVAVPVRFGDRVIGLLEVFSPQPNAFGANDNVVLQHLADTILGAINREARASSAGQASTETTNSSMKDDTLGQAFGSSKETAMQSQIPSSPGRRFLMLAAGVTLLIAFLWLGIPWIKSLIGNRKSNPQPPTSQATSKASLKRVADTTSLESLRIFAEQGDPAAQFDLGARYATGEDVKQDYAEAVRWFTMAAEQGHIVAQATLGAYYWAGRGVPLDLNKAYFWSILAQAGGDEASKYRVAVLASRMTHAQVVAAQQAANDWIKQHQLLTKVP
jgi:putative methionine-R-sulfoxide reductase with GAF domain